MLICWPFYYQKIFILIQIYFPQLYIAVFVVQYPLPEYAMISVETGLCDLKLLSSIGAYLVCSSLQEH